MFQFNIAPPVITPIMQARNPNSGNKWPSTSAGNVYPFGFTPAFGLTAPPNDPISAASAAPYFFSVSAQLAAPNFVVLSYSLTNAAGVTNGPNPFHDVYTTTNYGVMWDDGNISYAAGNGGRPQQPCTLAFDFIGFFQNSFDGTGNILYSNVTVTFANVPNTGYTNIVIDAFNQSQYSGGNLIDVWTNWFGAAWKTNQWSATNDANGNPSSGSINVLAQWPVSPVSQFMVWDQAGGGIVPPFSGAPNRDSGLNLTDFGADVFYDTSSPVVTNSGVPIYGHLRFGMQDFAGNFQQFSNSAGQMGFDYVATNNYWQHVNFGMNAFINQYETVISNTAFGIDGNWYTAAPLTNGTTSLFVDNIHFLEQANLVGVHVVNPPPNIAIQSAIPGLRIFARSTTKYVRNELGSDNSSESWVGAGSPVSYSFTVSNLPPISQGLQLQIWLIPVNAMPSSLANPYSDNQIDSDATNAMALIVNSSSAISGTNQVYGEDLLYKTNAPAVSLNPGTALPVVTLATNYQTAVLGSASANGTWTLTFTDNNHGSITGPGLTPKAFTIPTGDEQYFNGNLVAYFGIQPNGAVGVSADYSRITIAGTAGPLDDNFAAGADLSHWTVVGDTLGMWLAPVGSAWWVNWSTPAIGYDVEENNNNNIAASSANWVAPAYYVAYSPNLDERLQGVRFWTLIASDMLPPGQTNGYFRLAKPAHFP
jgi:hypothetical protein